MKTENVVLTEGVFYILLSLYSPLHGYGIMQNVVELSNGRVKLAPGTLYGAINTLLEKNWIVALRVGDNQRKKEYQITELGKKVLGDELLRLEELLKNGRTIMKGEQ